MSKPAPSEWGKLSAGQAYIPFAFDFARAVFSIGLGENTGSLLWYVVERSWGGTKPKDGWTDPQPVKVPCNELAEQWGVARQRVSEAKRWLVAARILIETEQGLYVNKNADEWIVSKERDMKTAGSPLVTPERLAYAAEGRTRTRKSHQESPCNVRPLLSHVQTLQEGEAQSRSNVTDCHGTTLQMSRSNVTAHIEERAGAAKEKRKEEKDNIYPPQDPKGPDKYGYWPMEDCPAYPGPNYPLDVTPGKHKHEEKTVRPIFRMLWRGFGSHTVCNQFYERQEFHHADIWIAAIKQARIQKSTIFSLTFIQRIAESIEAMGLAAWERELKAKEDAIKAKSRPPEREIVPFVASTEQRAELARRREVDMARAAKKRAEIQAKEARLAAGEASLAASAANVSRGA